MAEDNAAYRAGDEADTERTESGQRPYEGVDVRKEELAEDQSGCETARPAAAGDPTDVGAGCIEAFGAHDPGVLVDPDAPEGLGHARPDEDCNLPFDLLDDSTGLAGRIDHRAQSVRHAMEMQMDELREQGVEQGTDVF